MKDKKEKEENTTPSTHQMVTRTQKKERRNKETKEITTPSTHQMVTRIQKQTK